MDQYFHYAVFIVTEQFTPLKRRSEAVTDPFLVRHICTNKIGDVCAVDTLMLCEELEGMVDALTEHCVVIFWMILIGIHISYKAVSAMPL